MSDDQLSRTDDGGKAHVGSLGKIGIEMWQIVGWTNCQIEPDVGKRRTAGAAQSGDVSYARDSKVRGR